MKTDPKIIILLVLLVGVIIYCFAMHGGSGGSDLEKARASAQTYTAESVKVVTAKWDAAELQQRAHPLLMQGVKESGNSMEEYFKVLSQLGEMKKDPECAFLNAANVLTASGSYVTSSHMCNTEYTNGPAAIGVEVRAESESGPWQVVNFQVNSPFFSKKTGNPKEDAPAEKKAQ